MNWGFQATENQRCKMQFRIRVTNSLVFRSFLIPPSSFRMKFSNSIADTLNLDDDCGDFLPWLQQKSGTEISSVLSIRNSIYGRSLCASRVIHIGDCILKIPYSVHLTPDNVHPHLKAYLGDDIGSIARLALVILTEKKLGQDSGWAPYIGRLPQMGQLHCTVFWSADELKMVRPSSIYEETFKHRILMEKEYTSIKPVLDHFPEVFGVGSRAWGTSKGLSLIPYADFFNHDGVSKATLLSDDEKEVSEVVAEREYVVGEQVLISYGKFSNATLLLDFGFTLPDNIYDQVSISMEVPRQDPLREMKLELLHKYSRPSITTTPYVCKHYFTIKEVKSARGKGRGIPQSLRAFVRILSITSLQELNDLMDEASLNDGRLARKPLRSKNREIKAHQILLSHLIQLVQKYETSIKVLQKMKTLRGISVRLVLRRQMAYDLLSGELHILRSAVSWLKNYCLFYQQMIDLHDDGQPLSNKADDH